MSCIATHIHEDISTTKEHIREGRYSIANPFDWIASIGGAAQKKRKEPIAYNCRCVCVCVNTLLGERHTQKERESDEKVTVEFLGRREGEEEEEEEEKNQELSSKWEKTHSEAIWPSKRKTKQKKKKKKGSTTF